MGAKGYPKHEKVLKTAQVLDAMLERREKLQKRQNYRQTIRDQASMKNDRLQYAQELKEIRYGMSMMRPGVSMDVIRNIKLKGQPINSSSQAHALLLLEKRRKELSALLKK